MVETNYAVPPGEYITEWLEENYVSHAELEFNLGVSASYVTELISGKIPISIEVATNLEKLTGIPVKSWVALDRQYWTDRARIRRGQVDDVEPTMTVVSREVDEENDLIFEVLEER